MNGIFRKLAILSAAAALSLSFAAAGHAVGADEVLTEPPTQPALEETAGTLLGDTDQSGSVNSKDARNILRAAASLDHFPAKTAMWADMDLNGKINSKDARLALQNAAGLATTQRHDFALTKSQDPTCEGRGSASYHCSGCGVDHTVALSALGHKYKTTEQVKPTCTAAGKTVQTCTVCGKKTTSKIAATGHKWVAATAKKAKHCKNCGKVQAGWEVLFQ